MFLTTECIIFFEKNSLIFVTELFNCYFVAKIYFGNLLNTVHYGVINFIQIKAKTNSYEKLEVKTNTITVACSIVLGILIFIIIGEAIYIFVLKRTNKAIK